MLYNPSGDRLHTIELVLVLSASCFLSTSKGGTISQANVLYCSYGCLGSPTEATTAVWAPRQRLPRSPTCARSQVFSLPVILGVRPTLATSRRGVWLRRRLSGYQWETCVVANAHSRGCSSQPALRRSRLHGGDSPCLEHREQGMTVLIAVCCLWPWDIRWEDLRRHLHLRRVSSPPTPSDTL